MLCRKLMIFCWISYTDWTFDATAQNNEFRLLTHMINRLCVLHLPGNIFKLLKISTRFLLIDHESFLIGNHWIPTHHFPSTQTNFKHPTRQCLLNLSLLVKRGLPSSQSLLDFYYQKVTFCHQANHNKFIDKLIEIKTCHIRPRPTIVANTFETF